MFAKARAVSWLRIMVSWIMVRMIRKKCILKTIFNNNKIIKIPEYKFKRKYTQLNKKNNRVLTRCMNDFDIKDFAMFLEKKSEYNKGMFHYILIYRYNLSTKISVRFLRIWQSYYKDHMDKWAHTHTNIWKIVQWQGHPALWQNSPNFSCLHISLTIFTLFTHHW